MVYWLRDEQRGIALDTDHDPVVISTWYGQPSARLVDAYYRWSDTTAASALAAEQQLVHIVDLSQAKLPLAAVRKRLVEHAHGDLAAELTLSTIVIAADPAIRGLVAAMRRVSRGHEDAELDVVETTAEAIELALHQMWDARIPPPFGLDPGRYQAPSLEPPR